jgi:hypothetical protein
MAKHDAIFIDDVEPTAARRVSQGANVDAERVCEFLQGSEAVRVVGCCEGTCLIETDFGRRTSTGIPNAVRFQRHTQRRGELVLREPKLQANGADVASVGPWR